MCGVAGIFAYSEQAPPVDRDELLRIRERMIRRGPDGAGLWIAPDRRIGLAHRRLAIIDLTPDGAQPMVSADKRYQIVFNGEIYNYRELRDDLRRKGVVFRSQSDTEVLLELYASEGAPMCRKLRGMYSLAIWDNREQSLFLARDPFGIKPLYVHDDGITLRFASQVKALLEGGAVPRDIDPTGEAGYWIWGHLPEPYTLYKNVRSHEPGTWLRIYRAGRREHGKFESLESLLRVDAMDASVNLRDVLLESVRHHLIADVPIGIFLSSGIDSTTLAVLATQCSMDVRSVTLGLEEFRGTNQDETTIAARVANQYGLRHETVWIGEREFEESFDEFLREMDLPTIDGLNTWLVSRAASKLGLKVAISGLGGDEFFGGYPSFLQLPIIKRAASPFRLIPGLGKLVRRAMAPALKLLVGEKTNSYKYASVIEYGGTWQGAYLLRRAVRMPWEIIGDRASAHQPCPKFACDWLTIAWLEATHYMRNQ